uniref:S100 calcium binding protein A13 n=1 Tax=Equus asinus TaxID=9793 RepID=A0A9L0JRX7_EQUAS
PLHHRAGPCACVYWSSILTGLYLGEAEKLSPPLLVGTLNPYLPGLEHSSGREGRKGSLSVNEFKELATQQLPHLLKDVGSLDEKMKSLDVNQDSELKFHEYWRLIGELAKEIRKEKAQEIRKK